jgi:hypothetical protein
MADETSISNLALAKLGIDPIMALSDASKPAQYCSRFYASTRDEVLSAHRWNFAMARATLNRLTAAPAFEWAYAYQLPADCLRVLQLNGYEQAEQKGMFSVEGRQLFTDEETAEVRHIARVEDASAWPPSFVDALATKLAANIAAPLTGSRTAAAEMLSLYASLTGPQARMADALEGNLKRKPAWALSPLVAARHGGGYA